MVNMPKRLKMHKYVASYGILYCRRRRQNYVLAHTTVHKRACKIQRKARTLTAITLQSAHHFVIVVRVVLLPIGHWPKVILIEKPQCWLLWLWFTHTILGVSVVVAVASWLPTRKFVVFGIFTAQSVKKGRAHNREISWTTAGTWTTTTIQVRLHRLNAVRFCVYFWNLFAKLALQSSLYSC